MNKTTKRLPFNWSHMTGKERYYIVEARFNGSLAGDGPFTRRCHRWLEERSGCKTLLTHSCTAALEMAALLLDLQSGGEVIMSSYTSVSTANAFALRGGVPVFVDIREDTFNLDEQLIESAITPRTRAIVPVHYAGAACEMNTIMAIARRHGLKVVEDAAQGVMARYKGRALALRAEIIHEKGTDRSGFFLGEVKKYTWQEVGSPFLPGELIAAFLWAQLEAADQIADGRLGSWQRYHELLETPEAKGVIRRPVVPDGCEHNAHMYNVLLAPEIDRQKVLDEFRRNYIWSVFHYVPLHSPPAGRRYGRVHGKLDVTDRQSARLVRLPMWFGISAQQQHRVVDVLEKACMALLEI